MLLISPSRAALAIGSQCSNPDGTGDESLLEMLRLMTPKVEDALNVHSLTRGVFTDTFPAAYSKYDLSKRLRLANGFVVPGSVTIAGVFDDSGVPITTPFSIDAENGIVGLPSAYYTDDTEQVSVTYTSGFVVPEDTGPTDDVNVYPEYRVLVGIPDWMSGATVTMLMNWRRNNLNTPAASKEYGFLPTLNAALIRDLYGRLYGRYLRPRDHVFFPLSHTSV